MTPKVRATFEAVVDMTAYQVIAMCRICAAVRSRHKQRRLLRSK